MHKFIYVTLKRIDRDKDRNGLPPTRKAGRSHRGRGTGEAGEGEQPSSKGELGMAESNDDEVKSHQPEQRQKEISSQEKKGNQGRRERRKEGASSLAVPARHARRSAQDSLCAQRQKRREPMGAGGCTQRHWSRVWWQRLLLSNRGIAGLWADDRHEHRREDSACRSWPCHRLRTKSRG